MQIDGRVYKRVRCTWVAMLLVSLLAVLGCETDSDNFAAVGASNLTNRGFTFANGAAFGIVAQSATLTFGDFNNDGDGNSNSGPFTLTSSSGTATGTVTVASCNLKVATSTFNAAVFPGLQPAQTVPLDPCQVDIHGALRVQNSSTQVVSNSAIPTPAGGGVAFVLTTDFFTGSYSVLDLATRNAFTDIGLGDIDGDAVARSFNGLVYVVNRGGDNIQLIDPQQGYTTTAQESVGNGTNPQDIVVVNSEKAYVSRLKSAELLIIHPTTLAQLGTIDLSHLTKANDLDGVPELFRLLLHDDLVYLILQHLDFSAGFIPTRAAPGEVVVIDPSTDTVVTVIALNGRNPNSDLQYSAALDRILVSSVGDFGVNDGGLEAINPATHTVDAGFVMDEATIGGEITHAHVISDTKGFAVVADASFVNTLVQFNPSTGAVVTVAQSPAIGYLPHFAINQQNELYLAVVDFQTSTPSVQVFDVDQDVALMTDTLEVGGLPPNWIVFIEE